MISCMTKNYWYENYSNWLLTWEWATDSLSGSVSPSLTNSQSGSLFVDDDVSDASKSRMNAW